MDKDIEWAIATVFGVGLGLFIWMGGVLGSATGSTAPSSLAMSEARSAEEATAPPAPATETFEVASTVNIRSGPGTDEAIVDQLTQGDRVEVEAGSAEWRRIAQGPHAGAYVYTPVLRERRSSTGSKHM